MAIFCAYRVGGPAGAIVGGLGFVVPAVVLILALSVLFLGHPPPLWVRGTGAGGSAGAEAAAVLGSYLVLALVACGLIETLVGRRPWRSLTGRHGSVGLLMPASISAGGIGALA